MNLEVRLITIILIMTSSTQPSQVRTLDLYVRLRHDVYGTKDIFLHR